VDGAQSGNGAYAQIEHRLCANATLVGGIQANKVGALDFDVVPRGGIISKLSTRWTAKALYSQAFHAPMLHETLLDYDPPAGNLGPSLDGDPKLKAEKVSTIDLVLSYERKRFEATLDYYHSDMQNRIVLGPDAGGYNWIYSNQGEVNFQGMELDGKYYVGEHLFVTASAIGQRSRSGAGVANITPIPGMAAKAGVGYQKAHQFTAAIFDVFQGSIPGGAGAENPKPTAHDLLSANFRLELSHYLRNVPNGIAVVAHGENLTNHAVWLPNTPDVPADTIFANRGRTVYAGLEFAIGKD